MRLNLTLDPEGFAKQVAAVRSALNETAPCYFAIEATDKVTAKPKAAIAGLPAETFREIHRFAPPTPAAVPSRKRAAGYWSKGCA